MQTELSSIWNAALGELEVTLSRASFTTWFKNTGISDFKNGVVTVAVPSGFIKEWIQNKFHKQIKEALSQLLPDVKDVAYKVGAPIISEVVVKDEVSEKIAEKPKDLIEQAPVDARYTFENFVVGPSNRLAHAAALSVAENPGQTYNPLFIYGSTGLGKTHLMCAIANQILKKSPSKKISFLSSENFTKEFITAVKSNNREGFADRYEKLDALLIDDIHFLAGREGTIEQFFHVFNSLHHSKKQIIISSDRPPKAIQNLPQRLVSRLEGGLITDIQTPDTETKAAIVREKSEERNFPLSDEACILLAEASKSNIRELEGLLNQVMATCQLQGIEPTLELITNIIGKSTDAKLSNLTPEKIIRTVTHHFEIKKDDLLSQKRDQEIVFARQTAMYLMREQLGYSYPKIARAMGGRDHTTIMYGCEKLRKLLKFPETKETLEQIIDKLAQ